MKGRKIGYLSLSTTVIIILGIIFFLNSNKSYSSFITLGCTASVYELKSDVGYLTITYDNSKINRAIVLTVDDMNLQNKLSQSELSDVIGVNLILNIPSKLLKERHIDVSNIDPFKYLIDDSFDEYLTLVDISFK